MNYIIYIYFMEKLSLFIMIKNRNSLINHILLQISRKSCIVWDICKYMFYLHSFISTNMNIEIYKINPDDGQLTHTLNFKFNDLRDITIGGN